MQIAYFLTKQGSVVLTDLLKDHCIQDLFSMYTRDISCRCQVSEAIMDEDDEQANVDRNIHEIDDQM